MPHLLLTLNLLFLPHILWAQEEEYQLLAPFPGAPDASDTAGYFEALYNFLIISVGIAALLMIVVGGIWYVSSAGNQARMGTAKTIITDALLGLAVVFLAWLILNTINPDLVKGNLSRLAGDFENGEVELNAEEGGSQTLYGAAGGTYDSYEECKQENPSASCQQISTDDNTNSSEQDGQIEAGNYDTIEDCLREHSQEGCESAFTDDNTNTSLVTHNLKFQQLEAAGITLDGPYPSVDLSQVSSDALDDIVLFKLSCDCIFSVSASDGAVSTNLPSNENLINYIADNSDGFTFEQLTNQIRQYNTTSGPLERASVIESLQEGRIDIIWDTLDYS